MKRQFGFSNFVPEIKMLVERSPMTAALSDLACQADFELRIAGRPEPALRRAITAATDPWSEVEYQSLYLRGFDPEDRIVLQQPTVKDPMVGVMVLKAARLSGESGMVYCGKPESLKAFGQKLGEYEKRGADLDEQEFLECLMEAAEADGLKVVYHQLSPDHGGSETSEDEG